MAGDTDAKIAKIKKTYQTQEKQKHTSTNSRMWILHPRNHIQTHEHLREHNAHIMNIALAGIQRQLVLHIPRHPPAAERWLLDGHGGVWPERVGSVEIEQAGVEGGFAEFDGFGLGWVVV